MVPIQMWKPPLKSEGYFSPLNLNLRRYKKIRVDYFSWLQIFKVLFESVSDTSVALLVGVRMTCVIEYSSAESKLEEYCQVIGDIIRYSLQKKTYQSR